MTKNIFIVAIAVLLSVAFCSLSAQNVSKDYNVDEFSAINLQSVGNIIFTQSAGCSCRLEGPSEFVEKTRVTVKNGTLAVSYTHLKTVGTRSIGKSRIKPSYETFSYTTFRWAVPTCSYCPCYYR